MSMEEPERKDALRESLERACRIIQCDLDQVKLERSRRFLEELALWNKAYNLVGKKMQGEGLIGHFLDSLTPLLYEKVFGKDMEMLDLGSGAGLPGVPLYIFKGPMRLTLVEPVRKKQSFLRHIRRTLDLEGLEILGMRSEDMAREDRFLDGYERIFMRAVAEPARAVRLALPLLSSTGLLVLFLGKEWGEAVSRGGGNRARLGMKVENIRSTKKITGKDSYIALLRKQE